MKWLLMACALTIGALTGVWYAHAQTPTPGECQSGSAQIIEQEQFVNRTCWPHVLGPTNGKCVIAVVDSVPVLDCDGGTRQKFTMAAWP